MKKLLLLCLVLLGGVMQVSATDYYIFANSSNKESEWVNQGQMTDPDKDGTYSLIIQVPKRFDDNGEWYHQFCFTIFTSYTLNWDNAYRPKNADSDFVITNTNDVVTMDENHSANNYTIKYPNSWNDSDYKNYASALKLDYTPSTNKLKVTRLIAIASSGNSYSIDTDYLTETSNGSQIYQGRVAIEKDFKIVLHQYGWEYWGRKKVEGDSGYGDGYMTNAAGANVAVTDGVYDVTADLSTFKWADPVRVTVPASVATYGMGTIGSQYALDFTDASDIHAYAITGVSGNTLTLSERITGKVPANTGLYIEGTKNADIPTTIYTTPLGVTNYMVAGTGETVSQTDGVYTNFILTTNKGQSATPKFYMVNSNGMTVSAGKAYLQIPTTDVNSRDFFWFDNETTGIDKVDVNANDNFDANAPIYNLAGQRVSKNYKGVVIVNGKKVVIK